MTVRTSTLGFPRIGPRRELKTALENHWSGRIGVGPLQEQAEGLRAATWARQHSLGVTQIPSNDFSFYDHVLDTAAMVGAVPAVYGWTDGAVPLDTYFAMARGTQSSGGAPGLPALEMTKWFDTNYHYMVPELHPGQRFTLASTKPLDEFLEAKRLGFHTRPMLVGPVTWLLLGKVAESGLDPLSLMQRLLPVYAEILNRLGAAGADWVQMDEPCLALDMTDRAREVMTATYKALAVAAPDVKLLVASYFGGLGGNLDTAIALPVAGLHIDLVRAPGQIEAVMARAPSDLVLSLGVIDGRNVWRADLNAVLDRLESVVERLGAERVILAPSCSLLHVPIDLDIETGVDDELKRWLAFAVQKIGELDTLARALGDGRSAVQATLDDSASAVEARRRSPRIHDAAVQARLAGLTPAMAKRGSAFPARRKAQHSRRPLPAFPTTTIGSFPQTDGVRKARAAHKKGAMDDAAYEAFLKQETAAAVRWQEEIGIDVLVHGEFERNDMVQYFGEQLAGYAFTTHGWVQSYGSRCVRPPVIYGDVSRPHPMTVYWSRYAQSLTKRPVKGMLTGPVTMLQWSFVRDDLPRRAVCRQIALAIRDEVADLEKAGIGIVQIDEPAFREGLPLRRSEWRAYLGWAVECFRLASSGVADTTQIHTHMCYSEFNDIIDSIGALDADVISIETARSKMELLDAFIGYRYPNEIGPGVYDIHAPRRPDVDEMAALLRKAKERLAPDQIWVNPDCGLKTRRWDEVRPALANMVQAARALRGEGSR